MSFYMAELDDNNVILRVAVAPTVDWMSETLSGTWAETGDPNGTYPAKRYAGIGWRYYPELDQFYPWAGDMNTCSIWCPADEWDSLTDAERSLFIEQTDLSMIYDRYSDTDWVILGGREITDGDVTALGSLVGLEPIYGFPAP